eukprot:TRINITY_DN45101_c0_g1_i1.p1 TRINITY_DN45101_c0_g1~~TRINITY_DN45101_c0_g1_i1.p1  ORF type:complete len:594 (-),score=92.62 TRINITY_DN45101_c0_g1_i1:776-2443(-)
MRYHRHLKSSLEEDTNTEAKQEVSDPHGEDHDGKSAAIWVALELALSDKHKNGSLEIVALLESVGELDEDMAGLIRADIQRIHEHHKVQFDKQAEMPPTFQPLESLEPQEAHSAGQRGHSEPRFPKWQRELAARHWPPIPPVAPVRGGTSTRPSSSSKDSAPAPASAAPAEPARSVSTARPARTASAPQSPRTRTASIPQSPRIRPVSIEHARPVVMPATQHTQHRENHRFIRPSTLHENAAAAEDLRRSINKVAHAQPSYSAANGFRGPQNHSSESTAECDEAGSKRHNAFVPGAFVKQNTWKRRMNEQTFTLIQAAKARAASNAASISQTSGTQRQTAQSAESQAQSAKTYVLRQPALSGAFKPAPMSSGHKENSESKVPVIGSSPPSRRVSKNTFRPKAEASRSFFNATSHPKASPQSKSMQKPPSMQPPKAPSPHTASPPSSPEPAPRAKATPKTAPKAAPKKAVPPPPQQGGEARPPRAARASGSSQSAMDLLGLHEGFTPSDLRGAYKRAAMQWHPDRPAWRAAGEAEVKRATEMFQRTKDAYELLAGK